MKKLCVVGSLNIDMTVRVSEFPRPGETILMDNFKLFIGGGKGANQAVAAGRLGADVRMVGLLGDLFYGPKYLEVFAQNNVKCDTVEVLENEYPGIAYVAVNDSGNNILFVSSGTNMKVTPEYIDRHWPRIGDCDIFLFQQEIPQETNLHLMKRVRRLPDRLIILDPAPAGGFTPEYLSYADILTPNENEMAMIAGMELTDEASYREACAKLHAKGARNIIAKTGRKGAYLSTGSDFSAIPTFDVQTVDSTAAGDSFNAGLAYGLSLGLDLRRSVRLGHAVASISTTRLGAQDAMPDLATLSSFLAQNDPELAASLV